jgi:hypothetical protein
MPNWCTVELIIDRDDAGSQADRQTVWEIWRKLFDEHKSDKDRDDKEVFNILRPSKDTDGNMDRSALWGTKWDIKLSDDIYFNGETAYNSTSVSMTGDCAWCPPDNLVDYLRELGFEVECNHISLENGCWGTDSDDCNNLNCMYIDTDDQYDDNAIELYEKFGIGDILPSQLYSLILGVESTYGLPQMITDEADWIAEEIYERFDEWKDNFRNKVDNDKERRNKVMELAESGLEDNNLNEGDYLTICNLLKKGDTDVALNICITKCDARDITDYFEPKVIDYYKTGEEQQIISCY